MEQTNGHGYISHKVLAEKFQVHRNTLRNELKKIKELKLRKMQRLYSPAQQEIIFRHLGNPFAKT